jgi:monoamine oxidase
MGSYNNIGISLSDRIFDWKRDTYLVSKVTPETEGANRKAIGFVSTRHRNLLLGFVGGRFAADLERNGQSVVDDFVREEFRRLWGSRAERSIARVEATTWGQSSVSLGAYSSASPGSSHIRAVLKEPLDAKLYFAGEACSLTAWGTAHGAYASGKEAAERVWLELRRRGFLKESTRRDLCRSALPRREQVRVTSRTFDKYTARCEDRPLVLS